MIRAILSALLFYLPLVLVGWILVVRPGKITIPLAHLGVMTLMAIIAFGVWKLDSPFPNPLNWDIHEHQVLINEILKARFSLIPSQLSDTFQFDGYTSLFHFWLAIPQWLFRPDPLSFWWVVEFGHLLSTILASYLLALAVTRIKQLALLSAVIGTVVFESASAFTSLFLLPQTLAAVIIVLLLAGLFAQEKVNAWAFITAALVAGLVHFLVGAVGIGVTLFTWLMLKSKPALKSTLMLVASLIAAFGIVVLSGPLVQNLNLSLINTGEAAAFIIDLPRKLALSQTFYGWSLFLLFPLGVLVILKGRNRAQQTTLALAIMLLGITASSFPYALKLYTLGRYFVHLVMASGLWYVISNLSKRVQSAAILLVAAAFLPIYVSNITIWKEPLLYRGLATQASDGERAAAAFLKARYTGVNALLVSDPATAYLLESTSGVNTQGGAYATGPTRKALLGAVSTSQREVFLTSLWSIRDKLSPVPPQTLLLAYSGRTAAWLRTNPTDQMSIAFNIWVPKALSLWDLRQADALSRQFALPIIYQNQDVVVFDVPRGSL